jgi:hypothetical protein
MAAIFIPLDDGGVFKGSMGNSANLVTCDMLNAILYNQAQFSILTNVTVSGSEVVQFFQSFDDLIHYFYFGQGLGQIHFDLTCFFDCSDNAPGLDTMWALMGATRGKKVTVNIGRIQVVGVLMDYTISLTAEPIPMYNISINLGMISNSMTPANITAAC